MKKLLVIVSLVAGTIIFNSCGSSRYTVTERPATPVYVRPARPAPSYIWIDGGWRWRHGRYIYSNGYWARPRGHRVYVPGKWMHTNRGYYWNRGHWR